MLTTISIAEICSYAASSFSCFGHLQQLSSLNLNRICQPLVQLHNFRTCKHHNANPMIVILDGKQVLLIIIGGKRISRAAAYTMHVALRIDCDSGQTVPRLQSRFNKPLRLLEPTKTYASRKCIGEHRCTRSFLIRIWIVQHLMPKSAIRLKIRITPAQIIKEIDSAGRASCEAGSASKPLLMKTASNHCHAPKGFPSACHI